MLKVLYGYFSLGFGVIILAIISFIFWDKRYQKNHGTRPPAGFEKTEEVSIDPKSNKKLRVYYNPQTGERFYGEED